MDDPERRLSPTTDQDLSEEQREWVPGSGPDLWEFVLPWKSEMWDGIVHLTSGGDPPWDWRTVAAWARALPGWRIELAGPYALRAHPPTKT